MMADEEIPDLLEVEDVQAGTDRPKIPITLLTGYLGAGKSTLLNYILTANHGYRIAVCMNDFGDSTDIEARTMTLSNPDVADAPETGFLSLPNGCLCCSFKDMGIAAIEEMVAAQPAGVDWVVVELTGVADPAPIAKSFWANEEMGDLILDGVVCVVDSRNVLKQLDEDKGEDEINECQKQVACADVILLNKADLVNDEEMKEVEDTVKTLNPTLRVHHTTQSQIALKELFDIRAFSASKSAAAALADASSHDHPHEASHGHVHPHLTTTVIPLPILTADQYVKFEEFIQSLLWESKLIGKSEGPEVLRSKGVAVLDDGRAFVLQGVRDLYELKELSGQDVQAGKVVFIGRGIGNGDAVKSALLRHLGIE